MACGLARQRLLALACNEGTCPQAAKYEEPEEAANKQGRVRCSDITAVQRDYWRLSTGRVWPERARGSCMQKMVENLVGEEDDDEEEEAMPDCILA